MLCGVGGVAVSGALPAALPSPSDPASLSGSSGGSTVGALVILSRMAAGFSLVIIYQSGNSYLAESVPTSVRNAYATVLHVAIAVGGLLTTGLACKWQRCLNTRTRARTCVHAPAPAYTRHPALRRAPAARALSRPHASLAALVADERWRALLALNSSPAFAALLVVGPFVLGHESPRWLLVTGREESACRLVQKIAAKDAGSVPSALRSLRLQVSRRGDGGKAEDDGGSSDRERLRTGGGQGSCGQRLRQLCHPSLLRLHAVGCTVAFCLNFGSKGFETWLGSYVRGLGMPQLSTTVYFGAIAGKIVGDLINMAVGQRLGRLRCLQLSFAAAGVCVLLLCFTREPWALVTLACGQGAFVDIIWCNVYLYLAEAFPTSVRSTAFGLTMGVGRSGGVISASLGGMLSSVQLAFVLYAASFFVGAACIVCFGLETSRRPLADVV